jgi:hypothetical protein
VEEYRWRIIENGVLRRIFVPKGKNLKEDGENHIIRSFMTIKYYQSPKKYKCIYKIDWV